MLAGGCGSVYAPALGPTIKGFPERCGSTSTLRSPRVRSPRVRSQRARSRWRRRSPRRSDRSGREVCRSRRRPDAGSLITPNGGTSDGTEASAKNSSGGDFAPCAAPGPTGDLSPWRQPWIAAALSGAPTAHVSQAGTAVPVESTIVQACPDLQNKCSSQIGRCRNVAPYWRSDLSPGRGISSRIRNGSAYAVPIDQPQ